MQGEIIGKNQRGIANGIAERIPGEILKKQGGPKKESRNESKKTNQQSQEKTRSNPGRKL